RLFVFSEVEIRHAAVVVGVVVDEDRAVCARSITLLAVAIDRARHLLHDRRPLTFFHSIEAGVVIVVPRGHRSADREKERDNCDRDRPFAHHGWFISFSSSSYFTPPRSTFFGRRSPDA